MSMSIIIPFWKKRNIFKAPPFGGDVRPPVMSPGEIENHLSRLVFARMIIIAIILFVVCLNLLLSVFLLKVMDTKLYVADGSVFGCKLEPLE